MGYFRYWGKAEKDGSRYHLLPYHCLDVAAVGHVLLTGDADLRQKFAAITGLEEAVFGGWLVSLLALHDIGKFSESFQNLRPDILEQLQSISSIKQYIVRHDSLGNAYLNLALQSEELSFPPGISFYDWQDVVKVIIQPFAGHHGEPPRTKDNNNLQLRPLNYFSDDDATAAKKFAESVVAMFCTKQGSPYLTASEEIETAIKKASWLMAGFVVLCDWIGSNSKWFPFRSDEMSLEEYWLNHAVPQAQKAIREAGISSGIPLKELSGFSGLFPHISIPSPMQSFVEQCPLGRSQHLFILEDVTGSGKTEAALLLATRMMADGCGKGIFVALPTMATSNAMYDRLTKVYRRMFSMESEPSLVLAHGARHLSEGFLASVAGQQADMTGDETASAQCSTWLADNRKKALLADVGVGTLDQALLAVLPARFQSLRLYGLVGHVLIVDEVHAYDPYMNKLLQNLLAFHAALGGSAILLSATLPTHIRRDFIASFATGSGDSRKPLLQSTDYPLATSYSPKSGIHEAAVEATAARRCSVAVQLIADVNEVVRTIRDAAEKGKCVCWIRNTVHDALAAFDSLSGSVSADDLMLFHARFAMGDRLDIEERVTTTFGRSSTALDRHGKILVATQVVEQSLDLDFDLLITDLAPMDLLIQRAGRLHRHQRDEQGDPLVGGPDRRELPFMIVHSPSPDDTADRSWYKTAFPKASFVYPSHGCLWLTARLLADRKRLIMPDDARELIESAFTEHADAIPLHLQQRDQQAVSQSQTDKSLAHINMLKLDEGYAATVAQWREDMKTPTRLGGMDTTVRLAVWNGTSLKPWYQHERFPWDMSQVGIRSGLVDTEVVHTGKLGEEIARLKELLPDKGKWTVLVPLTKGEDGVWCGKALNKQGQEVIVIYDCLKGVTITGKGA